MASGEPLVLNQHKYIPKNVVLTIGDRTYSYRDGSITYINIIHDFVKRRFPVIQCGLEMEVAIIEELYKHRDDTKLKLDIYEQKLGENGEIVNTSLYLQYTFHVVPARDQTVYITTTDTETQQLMDVMKTLQNFEMYLIDMDVIRWFTTEKDLIFEEATYAAALQAMFVMREIPAQKVIATPPMLNGSLKNVNVPLEDMIHNIQHLNVTYGIYDGTPIVYYDLFYLYCLSKQKPNIVIESATDFGTVSFVLMNPGKPAREITGSCDDAKEATHWVNLNSTPKIFDTTPKDTAAKLATVTTVNSKGVVDKKTLDDNATTLKYIYANNDLSSAQLINELMVGPTVSVVALNSSVKFLKPYKDYTFVTDTSYQNLGLNGKIFRLLGYVLGIHREGSDNYITEVTMTLYTPRREEKES